MLHRVKSSRRMEKRCICVLAAQRAPTFRFIGYIRECRPAATVNVFLQALGPCNTVGLMELGQIKFDGMKARSNPSKCWPTPSTSDSKGR